ncbi:hypothetical protein NDU88_007495 [Pleurodeles waltl]|uniref:Uncharacterized protein n=1 Tax=Pleurodeles waltl TaxID=8319 RepID=A0AAV7N5I9_PLEWA|nr:hypothetical protein NDU88_007495 [Pleurodeles waltl]
MDVASHRVPDRSEEKAHPNRYPEVTNQEAIPRGGADREVKLHIDKTMEPVALRHQRIAFNLRPQVEKELDHFEAAGIIECVIVPTPWVVPIAVVRKS